MNELHIPEIPVRKLSPELIDFAAGSVAGCISIVSGHPFDTIKVRMQTDASIKGPIDCLKKMTLHEGPKSLFKGILPPLLTSTSVNAVIFAAYNYALKQITIRKQGECCTVMDTYFAGVLSGASQTIITCPTDVIKVRLQSKDSLYTGVYDCCRKTVRQYGFKGLFHGYGVTFFRDVPSFGAYFSSYYYIRDMLENQVGDIASKFIAGACAGAISWAAAYPLDVAKTVIQMNPNEKRNFVRVIRDIQQTHGMKFLFRGFGTTILRSVPVNAVVFPVYEISMELLHALEF